MVGGAQDCCLDDHKGLFGLVQREAVASRYINYTCSYWKHDVSLAYRNV
jgi:hypothetical protein